MGGLWKPWSRKLQVLISRERRIQAGHENVVKVIVKFVEDEGKAPREEAVGSSQIGQKRGSFVQRTVFKM
jgi:hypothetical protein